MERNTHRRRAASLLAAATAFAALVGTVRAGASPVAGDGLRPRHAAAKPPHSVVGPSQDGHMIVLKIAEDAAVALSGGRFSGPASSGLNNVLDTFGVHPAPAFAVDHAVLDELRAQAEAASGTEQADLNRYAHVRVDDASRTEQLLDALNALPVVEIAYAAAVPSVPTTPDFTARQTYTDAATAGIDSDFAQTQAGGNGAGVRIVDIEYDWRFSHEDLQLPESTFISGVRWPQGSIEHGTAVLGELVARNNGIGVTGIVPRASVRTAGACRAVANGLCTSWSVAQALADAAVHLRSDGVPAGVILIEQQWDPDGRGYLPVEVLQQEYDTIAQISASGITVVEAAGNGSRNLDAYRDANGNAILSRSYRDSGAIIVGAGQSATGFGASGDRKAESFTDYGSRVDVQGWGDSVTTTGYGYLWSGVVDSGSSNTARWYTSSFSGTSSASPIVTGAVAALQGVSVSRFGFPIKPSSVRSILAQTGTAQNSADASTKPIGPRPDLRAAIGWFRTNVGFAYQITAPTAGSTFSSSVPVTVRLSRHYIGMAGRFEVGALYSEAPGVTPATWHQPVANVYWTPLRWAGDHWIGNCFPNSDCDASATWSVASVPSQGVSLHGWAFGETAANKLPRVDITVKH